MTEEGGSSGLTVLFAGVANLAIAIAKLVGGVMTGSSAMLSEAAHSFADTLNQAFLMAALRRSVRPADAEHPFGYGKARYFWSLLAAVAVFVLGAGFSVFQGVSALVHPREEHSPLVAFVVLAVALVLDGGSLLRAVWQLVGEAREAGVGFGRQLLHEAEPTVRGVFFEDTAAVVGILLAAGGLGLDELLGTTVFDAVASLLIGVLLVGVALVLGRQNGALLIGQAVDQELVDGLREVVVGTDGIRGAPEVLTMQLGPDQVLMAARVQVDPDATGRDLEQVADSVEQRVREAYPDVVHVFLDPTPESPHTRTGGPTVG
ncbi:cation transporter [Nocardioides mangrovicus]|uniref:Cation transporter n=1 Tax=Nocardioides mangrovicus TaxID=2478913 RepID=A0A3L8P8E1_9ACTN|nr:cation diffusion facilitator family transporter [Nocardioides mangrovicus]RLV50979.1 cation transporter [Nocardioides mangrovicus]